MISKIDADYRVFQTQTHWVITFSAMAGPCEILARCQTKSEAELLASLSFDETRRIERKFSRYRNDNIIHEINNGSGNEVEVDEEFANLLTYVDQCYRLSDGLFDITSGVLRHAWTFKGESLIPDKRLIMSLKQKVGWDKVRWDGSRLQLQPGMEIDLGGVGKEYAVDRVADLLFQQTGATLMVNFGGDIRALTNEPDPLPWVVGIENPEQENNAIGQINLTNGGIATSGDVRRYCLVNGVRMGHILNPRTGWPVVDSPRSVTVLGTFCVEAGFLATLAMLQGADAEKFLQQQGIPNHCVR